MPLSAIETLTNAVQANDLARVSAILDAHPDLINVPLASNNGHTAIHFATMARMAGMVRLLMERGANARAGIYPLTKATTAFAIAEDRGYGEVADIILEVERSRPPAPRPEPAATPSDEEGGQLRAAVDANRPDLLKQLLDSGLDPDAKVAVGMEGDSMSYTWGMPLYECARNGKHEMAEMLLEKGADPNGQVYASGTPLSEAYGQRDERMIALLEKYGGKSNPSMAGLYRRKDLALRLLAEHGDTPLPDDGFGSGTVAEQLIGGAARGGDPEILQLGMDRVDWPKGDARWLGPLSAPLGFWNHWIGPWCHQEWDRGGYLKCFKLILHRAGPPTRRGRFGASLMHLIVTMGDHVRPEEQLAFAEAALDAGAPLNLRDDLLKSTPLGWACRWGKPGLVRLFLARGADPVEADAEPWAKPLAWAEKKGHSEIAAMLR